MTTDKQVVDSLTTQGKTTSQEEVPPQTIIGTFDTIESVRDAAVKARARVGFGLGNDILRRYGVKIADLPEDKWQEAGEWFVSLQGHVEIIRPVLAGAYGKLGPKSEMYETIIQQVVDGGAEGVIPFKVSLDDPCFDQPRDIIHQQFIAAELRRQTVQAEAMVNLAVGVTMMNFGTLTDPRGNRIGGHIKVSPQDLELFKQSYSVDQKISNDGGFIISITPKED